MWTFNTATIYVFGLRPVALLSVSHLFKPLTLNKLFSLKLKMQAENIFTCLKIDTLIINRVYYKLGQLQYLVRALKGK